MKILIDTCFWIALYNPDKHADKTDEVDTIIDLIDGHEIIIPFPSLYEFLNSKFSRKNDALNFQKRISRPDYLKLDDSEFKDLALESFFEKAVNEFNDVSLVDEIMKNIMSSKNYKIDYLISFDEGLRNYATSLGVKVT